MAGLTLKQTLDMTTETLQRGVIETLGMESKVLAALPFMTIEGAGYSYNVEKSLAHVQFRALNEAYTPSAGEKERKTEHLVILGGEAVVDTFQIEVHGNVNDLMAVEVALKTKAIANKFEKTFISGDSATEPDEFDGLDKRVSVEQTFNQAKVDADTGKTASSLAEAIDVLLDNVLGGADALLMNKKTRRKLTREARDSIEYTKNDFGVQQAQYGGINIIDVEADIMPKDDVVYAMRFGEREAVAGLQSKSGLNVRPLGELGQSPQLKTRIEWFVGMALFNPKAVAMFDAAAVLPTGE